MTMTKKQAEQIFKEEFPEVMTSNDWGLKRFTWNTFTDMLHRDGQITDNQVNKWDQPRFIKGGK